MPLSKPIAFSRSSDAQQWDRPPEALGRASRTRAKFVGPALQRHEERVAAGEVAQLALAYGHGGAAGVGVEIALAQLCDDPGEAIGKVPVAAVHRVRREQRARREEECHASERPGVHRGGRRARRVAARGRRPPAARTRVSRRRRDAAPPPQRRVPKPPPPPPSPASAAALPPRAACRAPPDRTCCPPPRDPYTARRSRHTPTMARPSSKPLISLGVSDLPQFRSGHCAAAGGGATGDAPEGPKARAALQPAPGRSPAGRPAGRVRQAERAGEDAGCRRQGGWRAQRSPTLGSTTLAAEYKHTCYVHIGTHT